MQRIQALTDEMLKKLSIMEETAMAAKLAAAAYREVAEDRLPELMSELGIESFKTPSGHGIKITSRISASVPAARRPVAYDWLREHGEGGAIKHNVVVPLGRESEDEVAEILDTVGHGAYTEEKVEPSTLSAIIRRMLSDGEDVPMDLFGVYSRRVAKITQPEQQVFGEKQGS